MTVNQSVPFAGPLTRLMVSQRLAITTETLYHYTTAQCLIDIFRTQKVWASNARFLNDLNETVHGIDLLAGEVRKRLTETENTAKRQLLTMCSGMSSFMHENPAYVFSLSENPDQLSQWRGYCNGGGFAIGFDRSELQNLIFDESCPTYLSQVIYNKEDQRRLIQEELDLLMQAASTGQLNDPGMEALVLAHLCGARFKADGFKEEAEWRVICLTLSAYARHFNYRSRGGLIIPYVELSMPNGRLPIREIVVGPTPYSDVAIQSVRLMLNTFGYEGVNVKVSSIPYRTV
jgi:Protein of unknown function (DUF2971)